jgi:nitrous oxidase accessory protein NosD
MTSIQNSKLETYGIESRGIRIVGSTLATISNNTFFNALSHAILIEGSNISTFYNHSIDESNLVGVKPVKYYFNQSNLIIENNYTLGLLYIAASNNITLRNITMKDADGIVLSYVTNSTVKNITISNLTSPGIYLTSYSQLNRIESSSITIPTSCDFYCYGIYLSYSNQNIINNNSISVGKYGCGGALGRGIYLYYSGSNNITNNNVTTGLNVESNPLYLESSNSNSITENNFNYLSSCGEGYVIYFTSSSNNVFSRNLVNNSYNSANSGGISLSSSSNNLFYDTTITIKTPLAKDIYISGTNNYTNYLINCSFNQSNVGFSSGTTDKLEIQWYLDVYVNNTAGYPSPGCIYYPLQTYPIVLI